MFVQITDQRNFAGHYLQVLDAHDNTFFDLSPDHVHAGITSRQCRMHAVMVNTLVHECISFPLQPCVSCPRPGQAGKIGCYSGCRSLRWRHGRNPCRGPAAIASLRPETLRPCLSACLPSGTQNSQCWGQRQLHLRPYISVVLMSMRPLTVIARNDRGGSEFLLPRVWAISPGTRESAKVRPHAILLLPPGSGAVADETSRLEAGS